MPTFSSYEKLSEIVSLCKLRGFIFQSSEIYGGLNSCWDYGPLGVQLKRNVKQLWWSQMTHRMDIVGLDASILMHPTTWKASGHAQGFTDPLVDCKSCKARFRQDHALKNHEGLNTCPSCGLTDLTEKRDFNLMFKTSMGPVASEGLEVYLRPETAQGIFVNFDNVRASSRKKLPFGIAQIGKSFRNEITPGNFVFRTREFEQMEMQYFVSPGEDEKWFDFWKRERFGFLIHNVGLRKENIRWAEHGSNELAHYAKAAFDIEFKFPFGWGELEGVHNRSDFDLKQHQEFSGKSLEYFDEASKEKYTPFVIETAIGADRLTLAVLCDSMVKEVNTEGNEVRNLFKINPVLAPYKAALLPLSKKEPLQKTAHRIFKELSGVWSIDYDESGSIGKRYRRQDEIGTPFCITVDFDTEKDQKVTVRHRDTMVQERVSMDRLEEFLFKGVKSFDEFGGN